ncbi:MAG TPA: hypothetical protein VGB85_34155 [Nannocystis sp.]
MEKTGESYSIARKHLLDNQEVASPNQVRSWRLSIDADDLEHIGLAFLAEGEAEFAASLSIAEASALFMRLSKLKEEGQNSLVVEHSGQRYNLEMPEGELEILWAHLGQRLGSNAMLIAQRHGPDRVRALLGTEGP